MKKEGKAELDQEVKYIQVKLLLPLMLTSLCMID